MWRLARASVPIATLVLLWAWPAVAVGTPDRFTPLAATITRSFVPLQLPDGNVLDPITREPAQRYSQAMLAYSGLRSGQRSGAADLQAFARRALGFIADHPESHQTPSVFEFAAVADSYRALPVEPVRGRLAGWLAGAAPVLIRPDGAFRGNKYLVEAYGWLELCHTDIAVPQVTCRSALRTVERGLVATAHRHATRDAQGRPVVVLPDPPAYNLLTLGYLGRALALMDERRAATQLLVSMARGTSSMIAPDGDGTYWGRSQGQGWALLLGTYGLEEAARHTGRAEAARFRAAAGLLLGRFLAKHVGGPYGTYPTPSFADDPLVRPPGIDGYANVATYAGLTAAALCWLADEDPLPADGSPAANAAWVLGGANGDFAAVRHGAVWMAVVGRATRRSDLRYDFGLAAAEIRRDAVWDELVPVKPMTFGAPDSAGPSLLVSGQAALPFGDRMTLTSSGTVLVRGGWRTAAGDVVRRAVFRFRPTADGVSVSVAVRAGDDIEYSVFALAPELLSAAVVDGPRTTTASLPFSARLEPGYANSDHRALTRVRLAVHVPTPCTLRFSHLIGS